MDSGLEQCEGEVVWGHVSNPNMEENGKLIAPISPHLLSDRMLMFTYTFPSCAAPCHRARPCWGISRKMNAGRRFLELFAPCPHVVVTEDAAIGKVILTSEQALQVQEFHRSIAIKKRNELSYLA